ncbi:hypothetical protein SAMN05428976_11912 [Clostridium sp. USBA 49]|jgi:hypothetical protein|uniref:hypothetical protein n=1 Tax=Clostridium TaxID=1485 RepID=UPI00099ACE5A|nr:MULTISPECIES: hypothetical protein [Clostridium]SKA92217.1 hypothetical protein SAMN05428976_11912 [Clostridium sp. USBA 49]
MNKKNIAFAIIFVGVFVSMIVLGILTRKSYVNDIDVNRYINDESMNLSISTYQEDITKVFTKFEDLNSIEDLEKVSPIIVRAQVDSQTSRNRYYLTTLTTVKVVKVYKGDINSDLISIFEPIDIVNITDANDIVDSLDGYNWMKEDKEYILFLRPLKDSHYTDGDTVYLPTSTILSKYQIDESQVSKLNKEKILNANLKYTSVGEQEVFLYEDKNIDKFKDFKEDVLHKYK